MVLWFTQHKNRKRPKRPVFVAYTFVWKIYLSNAALAYLVRCYECRSNFVDGDDDRLNVTFHNIATSVTELYIGP